MQTIKFTSSIAFYICQQLQSNCKEWWKEGKKKTVTGKRTLNTSYTYIHNWSLQPFSQDYDIAFHTPLMLCALIVYMSSLTYSLKSPPNDKFLRSFSWQFYLWCFLFYQKKCALYLKKMQFCVRFLKMFRI